MDKKTSVEECLNLVPNKFEFSVLVMNRARQIMLGSKTNVETTEYTKKSINKAIMEIGEGEIEIDDLRNRVKKDLITDNTFLKNVRALGDDNDDVNGDDILNLSDEELIDDMNDEIDDDAEDEFATDDYLGDDTDNT
jgi:DNA-directed RNA polymerase omega subunit